jgi:hypothetical protein
MHSNLPSDDDVKNVVSSVKRTPIHQSDVVVTIVAVGWILVA